MTNKLRAQGSEPGAPAVGSSWGRTDVMTTHVTVKDLFGAAVGLEPGSQVDDGGGGGSWREDVVHV